MVPQPVSPTCGSGSCWLLARRILQEYDAFTGELVIGRSLSEGSEIIKLDGLNPASVQPVEAAEARLLARPILQEYIGAI